MYMYIHVYIYIYSVKTCNLPPLHFSRDSNKHCAASHSRCLATAAGPLLQSHLGDPSTAAANPLNMAMVQSASDGWLIMNNLGV